jgi:hypothetical protein
MLVILCVKKNDYIKMIFSKYDLEKILLEMY